MSRPFSSRDYTGGYRSLRLFNAYQTRAEITNAAQTGLSPTGDFTIEAWIKLRNKIPVSGFYSFVTKYLNPSDQSFIFAYQDFAGVPSIQMYVSGNGTDFDRAYYTTDLPIGAWFHLAVVVDISELVSTTEITFFIDGVNKGNGIVGTTAASSFTSMYSGAADFEIGTFSDANALDGQIDDVRMWSDIRTDAEIRDNMLTELVGDEANLEGYWKLNGDLLDSTVNENHLTAAGTILPVFDKSGGVDV